MHRSDFLRCELLHRYGGLYADLDTLCLAQPTAALEQLHTHCAVLYDARQQHELLNLNLVLCRAKSCFTTAWHNALHARLSRRLVALQAHRRINADLREDALDWHEVCR